MRTILLVSMLLMSISSIADDFVDATILDMQAKQGFTNGIVGGGVESDNHKELTIQLGDMKVTARSFAMGGGVVYINNHPEVFVVGSTIKARLAKRGVLEVLAPDGKLLKFDVQRMEKTGA
jgi:hypothetical protein